MALLMTFKSSAPTALAAGCSLDDFSINSGPKLALTVHKVSANGQDAPGASFAFDFRVE